MKRYKDIYSKITDLNNIELAIFKASKGKTKRSNVKKILERPEYYAFELREMLINKTYKPSKSNDVKIYDGARKKERIISKPRFYPDQCVHWAIMLQIEPLLHKRMYHWCCASIKNRGIHYAGKKVKKSLINDKLHTKYCVQMDVHHFYQSINQDILIKTLERIFKDKDLIWLLSEIIKSYDEGLPIGFYTSQWLANLYLLELDNYIKHELKIKHYIRYMDDILMFGSNKRKLHKAMKHIEEYLNTKLDLKLKPNYQLYLTDSRPVDFLGYRFCRGYTTLRSSNFLRIKRRIKKIYKKSEISLHDAYSVISYNGWVVHSNCYTFFNKYIKPYISIEDCKNIIRNENRRMA